MSRIPRGIPAHTTSIHNALTDIQRGDLVTGGNGTSLWGNLYRVNLVHGRSVDTEVELVGSDGKRTTAPASSLKVFRGARRYTGRRSGGTTPLDYPVRGPDGSITTLNELLESGQAIMEKSEHFQGSARGAIRTAYFVTLKSTSEANGGSGSWEIGETAYKSRMGEKISFD